jgi:hypothetical protein
VLFSSHLMRLLRLVLILLLGMSAGAGVPELRAQGSPGAGVQAPTGARVRISAPGVLPRRVTGRVGRVTADTVVLQTRGAAVAVPIAAASRIEQSYGRSRDAGAARGLVFGALAGGAAMGVAVLSGKDFCIYVTCLANDPVGATGGFLIGAALGAPAGALIGALVGVEEWEAITPAHLRRLHVSPAGIAVLVAVP